jgi:curved DNA-binding protein CbpA
MLGRKTYYQILQVDVDADSDIIATVHRRLAQRYHPDLDPSPEASRRMLELNQAYDVLKNPEQRARYDLELARRRDRRSVDRFVKTSGDFAPSSDPIPFGEAGAPRGPAVGSLVEFGRYKGWTLGQIATFDPDFLEWFERSPGGRQYRTEIAQLRTQIKQR